MKFISEKASSKATPSKVIKYIMNPAKCCKDENGDILIRTIGLDDDRPYSQQFQETAELAGNAYTRNDRKYYHFKLTVSSEDYDPDGEQNITPVQLLNEAEELVHQKFPGREAVITIQYHNNPEAGNKEHLHAHIVINASSFEEDEKKLRLKPKDLDALRDYAYEAGRPYNLHERNWRDEVAEKKRQEQEQREREVPEANNISDWEDKLIDRHKKNFPDYSFKEQYRIAIDEAKASTTNLDTFQDYLYEHFQITTKISAQGKIKYKFPDRNSYSSGQALGADYTLEAIESALAETASKPSDFPELTREQIEAVSWLNRYEEEREHFKTWEAAYHTEQQGTPGAVREKVKADEYSRHRQVLENTAAFYRVCEEATNKEMFDAFLSEREREQMAELKRCRELLIEQERKKSTANDQSDFWSFRQEMINGFREDLNDTYRDRRDANKLYYNACRLMRRTDSFLVMLVSAGVAFYALKKEQRFNQQIADLKYQRDAFARNTSNPDTFYKAYGSDLAAGIMPGKYYLDAMAELYEVVECEQAREQYIKTLQTTGASLADKIMAAEGIRDMNIKEGRHSWENELYKTYGSDTRVHAISQPRARAISHPQVRPFIIHATTDWSVQRMVDVIWVGKKLGAHNLSEFELKVKEEGRKFGSIKKEYMEAQKQCNEAIEEALSKLSNNKLTIEEREQKIEAVRAAELAKLRPIEERFLEAKEFYIKCAQAMDTVIAQNSPYARVPEQYKYPPKEEKQDAHRRTPAEAEKERKNQWAELRDWSDQATVAVASRPGTGKANDLKAWAAEMEKHGCQVRITTSTISVKHPNSNQAVRLNRLGGDYGKEEIENGIQIRRDQNRTADRAGSRAAERDSRAAQGHSRAQSPDRDRSRERVR